MTANEKNDYDRTEGLVVESRAQTDEEEAAAAREILKFNLYKELYAAIVAAVEAVRGGSMGVDERELAEMISSALSVASNNAQQITIDSRPQ